MSEAVGHLLAMRGFILALLAICVAAPAAAQKPRPALPKGNPGTWVVTDDYPASALRGHIEGVVRFTLAIDAEGHPTDCKVTESTGYSDLDDAACAALLQRAGFTPATDRKGRAVPGGYSNSVRWQIPEGVAMELAPGYVITSFLVDTDGSISDCKVERAEGAFGVLDSKTCPPGGKVEPITDDDGNPVRKRVRMTMRIEVEDAPQRPGG